MNVAFLFFRSFDPQIGGVERVTDVLTKELDNRGYNISYFCFKKIGDQSRLAANTYYFPNPDDYTAEENKIFYAQFIKEHNIDICVLQEPRFAKNIFELFPPNNCRLISVFHGDPASGLRNFWKTFMRKTTSTSDYVLKFLPRLIKRVPERTRTKRRSIKTIEDALLWSDAVVCLSDRFKADLNMLGINCHNPKFAYIGNPTHYQPLQSLPPKEKMAVMVGRVIPHKNPQTIIRIWNRIHKDYPDWSLYIIGDGPMMDFYINLSRNNDKIIFTGQCEPEKYYERASVLCMASSNEGWGMVLVEAMSKGCVPIAFNSFSSITEIIDDGVDGVLVKPFSTGEYERKLRELLDDADYRVNLAINALKKVESFRIDAIVDKWINLFNKVMD